uniref:NADH dehydrogenase subunit 6 n=1 Tax=Aneurus similis TaxID=1176472 RepID=A0A172DYR5_9HEMI|nr:NADH dehydrogenase subunit 6 [Aneurus similis]AFI54677.1 NADH dehydrogenase subunit 6 [Aneurus similis]
MWLVYTASFIITPWLNHPLSMGLTLLVTAITTGMITGTMIKSFMYSYMLVITMVSGLLILFIYMSSIMPNKKFHSSVSQTILSISLTITITMLLNNEINSNEHLVMQEPLSMMSLFMKKNSMTIIMITILLMVMLIIASIININEGALRKSQ